MCIRGLVCVPRNYGYDLVMLAEKSVLRKLRSACLHLPGATETVTFGHPTFQVEKKTFAVLETYKGELGICVKVGRLVQGVFLKDSRFFQTPYIGKHGWVTLRIHAAPLNWREIRELVKGSYLLVAPKRTARTRPRPSPSARQR